MAIFEDLTISIVNHSHGMLLDHLLDDLNREGVLGRSNIVITNNVKDSIFPFEKWSAEKIEWIHNDVPKGFGKNHNFALRDIETKWLLILNPDIRLPPGVLKDMISKISDAIDIGIVAPCILSSNGRIEDSVRHNLSPMSLIIRMFSNIFLRDSCSVKRLKISADWVAGMFLLMPSQVYRDVKGFDERYFLYCEDCDLCIRVRLMGKRIIVNEEYAVIHDAQRKSHKHFKYLKWHINSLFLLWISKSWWTYTFYRCVRSLDGVEVISGEFNISPDF